MKFGPTRELYAYWNVARRGRAAPERGDLDLTTVRSALPDLVALERDEAGMRRIRHAGDRVDRLLGRGLAGAPFRDLWSEPRARTEIDRLTCLVEDAQQPLLAGLSAFRGADALPCELLILPLRCGGRTHARLLALLAVGPGAPPAAPGVDAARLGPVATLRMLGLDETAARGRDRTRRLGRLIVHEGGGARRPDARAL